MNNAEYKIVDGDSHINTYKVNQTLLLDQIFVKIEEGVWKYCY